MIRRFKPSLALRPHALAARRVAIVALWIATLATAGCQAQREQADRAAAQTSSDEPEWWPQKYVATKSGFAEPIEPIPRPTPFVDDNQRYKVYLGKVLFHDRRLSIDNSVACASCHNVNEGGGDGLPLSIGAYHQEGDRNSATILNAVFNSNQLADGRFLSLHEHVAVPLYHPKQMGSDWPTVMRRLSSDKRLDECFREAYADGLTAENIADAIASYETRLITYDAPFDKYLRGDQDAITREEEDGYALFKERGCVACHQGRNVGGNLYRETAATAEIPSPAPGDMDEGSQRLVATSPTPASARLKVPTLRNVALTKPYFHDGSAETLEEAVRVMASTELGCELPEEDVQKLVRFLETLTGVIERELQP